MSEKKAPRYNCCLKNRKPHEKRPEPNLIKSSSSLEIRNSSKASNHPMFVLEIETKST